MPPAAGKTTAVEQEDLAPAIQQVGVAARGYEESGYAGNFLNEHQIDGAQRDVAQMVTAASRFYEVWQRVRSGLPTSTEIESVVEPPTIRSQVRVTFSRWPWQKKKAPTGRFTRLVQLNERVRRTTETIAEVLPVIRNEILYARHYERNCGRLYDGEPDQPERLRDAEEMRLELEQKLRAIEGDVESLRAQAQSLTLYAQTQLTIQVQLLTVVLLVLTAAGVVAAFLK